MLQLNVSRLLAAVLLLATLPAWAQQRPNVVLIYTDDVGYGDISCYGTSAVKTPHIDRLAKQGIRFTNAHATSATCTPSRYALLTGQYPWRRKNTAIAPGDASLIIDQDRTTLADVFKRAGYATGIVGKWHLGLGEPGTPPDWNGDIKPGPLELGFDQSYIIPATLDRVPCVYIDQYKVDHLDPADPIQVSYEHNLGNSPTGKDNPELLRWQASPDHGHNNTIINGIGRIGFMTGGRQALWTDEDVADVFTDKATKFIRQHQEQPFFLYLATTDIHVPRVPHPRFAGKTGMGPRGDVILEMDWCVGEVMRVLDSLHLTENTIVIFSSDNGPVLDDGYADSAVALVGKHKPAGPLRGGKYSAFEAGTRVPLLVSWKGHTPAQVSGALISQVDFLASFAAMLKQPLKDNDAPDSFDMLAPLLGKSAKGRNWLIEQGGALSLVQGDWKYIEPKAGPKLMKLVNIESGNDTLPQLYHLKKDIGEKQNVAAANPQLVKEMAARLAALKEQEVTR